MLTPKDKPSKVRSVDEQVEEMLGWLESRKELSDVESLTICLQLAQFLKQLEDLKERLTDYDQLFNLQHSRMAKATKRWQDATGKHEIFPDLGDLLDWLLESKPDEPLAPPDGAETDDEST